MNILEMLKRGKSIEDLTEEFYDNLESAVIEYEAWKEAEEKKAKALAQKKLEEEMKMKKIKEARQASFEAMKTYLEALGIDVDANHVNTLNFILEILPDLEVARW